MSRRGGVPVLVVGAGPVGASRAILLAQQGLASLVVERAREPHRAPAAHVVNARTFEVLRAAGLDMGALDEKSGHFFVQVKEGGDYKPFYDAVDKEFVLRAKGHADVAARAERGYWGAGGAWGAGVFYLRIEPEALARMAAGVPYALCAANGADDCKWTVADRVTLTPPR
mgnify:CR=1 FL=1